MVTLPGPAPRIDPIKLCCGKRYSEHIGGVQCPDGLVMCCLCFSRFPLDPLARDPDDGLLTDVCKPCAAAEQRLLEARDAQRH